MRTRLVFIVSLLITSCDLSYFDVDYSTDEKLDEESLEYPGSFICWDDLLSQQFEDYFVYVFSYDCYYCNEIKKELITFCSESIYPVFLVEYTKSVTVDYKIEETIGVSDVKNVFIRGTPTIIYIRKGVVAANVAGKRNVLDFIDLNKNQ